MSDQMEIQRIARLVQRVDGCDVDELDHFQVRHAARVDAAERERFIREFWPLILGIVLLVFFSVIMGARYYVSTKVRDLRSSNMKLEKAKAILKSVDDLD